MPCEVSAVLLAAGSSKRMGRPKQLLSLGGRPAIVRCLESIRGASINDIIVVVGPTGDEIVKAIEAFPATIVRNETPDADMSESVRIGLKSVNDASSGVFVCLADHPLVKAETFISMCLCHAERPGAIVVPVYRGRKGHPPLLPRGILAEIETVPTLSDLIGRHSEKVYRLEVSDEGVVLDMDTWEDYQRILDRFSAEAIRVIRRDSCRSERQDKPG